MGMKALTTIYQNEDTGDCYVQPMVMGPVNWTEFGDPEFVGAKEFDARIGEAVLQNLARFNVGKFNSSLAQRRTPDENRRFTQSHKSVGVTLQESGEIVLRPLHREKGGYVGHDKEAILLKAPDVVKTLAGAIRTAFLKAS